jgi:predicted glutamine amidotransferase
MCRMFAYVGSSREDVERLIGALRGAARKDPVAEEAHMKSSVHGDGWGYAVYSKMGLAYHRSGGPIFREDVVMPPTGGKIFAIFHARQATAGNPLGEKSSHPFRGETEDGVILLAHNGAVDKNRLAERLRFGGDLDKITDSELVLKYAAENGLAAAATDLKDCTKANSALDLLALEIGNSGRAEIFVNHFYRKKEGRYDRTRYYELYYQNFTGGTAVFSSTFNDYGFSGKSMGLDGLVPLSPLGRG